MDDSFLMYTTPCDVPLDTFLGVEIEILGEFKFFLLLIKERDK